MGTVRHPLLIFVTDKSDRINFTMVRIFVMYVVLYLKPPKCTPSMVNLSTNEISAKSTNQLTFRHNRDLIALFVSGIMLKFYFSTLFSKVWKQLGRFSLNLVHNFSCMESTYLYCKLCIIFTQDIKNAWKLWLRSSVNILIVLSSPVFLGRSSHTIRVYYGMK